MRIHIITDDLSFYNELAKMINDQSGDHQVLHLADLKEIAVAADRGQMELAFVDTGFKEADCISVVRTVRTGSPYSGVILVAEDGARAAEAFAEHAQGYIIRPVTAKRIKEEIIYFNEHFVRKQNSHTGIEVMTNGSFECFIDGKPVNFKRKRAKTVLAFLISKRGAMASNSELMSMLWHDDANKLSKDKLESRNSNLRSIKAELERAFCDAGYPDLFRKSRGELSIDIDEIRFID